MPTSRVEVAATATEIVDYNARRIFLVIENVGDQTIYLGDDNAVATTTGVRLEAGDFWVQKMEGGDSKYYYRGAFYGICAATTANVQVLELEDSNQ